MEIPQITTLPQRTVNAGKMKIAAMTKQSVSSARQALLAFQKGSFLSRPEQALPSQGALMGRE